MDERHEEMGMTEQQFASYLNQLIGRFEDAMEIDDDEKRRERLEEDHRRDQGGPRQQHVAHGGR